MSKFKIGDTVKVSDNPGVYEAPGQGFVAPEVAGRTGTIIGSAWPDSDCIMRVNVGDRWHQYIHEAHLTAVDR